ncbi:unnamed protein product [Cylicocyclus nassatus]|uniref:Secreted protein n=1 Tax=Cylicocyclus nassatus TaxID=53992 RepID=A0AA36GW58_CYLNA|nr:unnamed protein product [Cylicocyclus nassatus]
MKATAITGFCLAAFAVLVWCLQVRSFHLPPFRPHHLPPPMVWRLIALEEREEKLKKEQEKRKATQEKLRKAKKGKK